MTEHFATGVGTDAATLTDRFALIDLFTKFADKVDSKDWEGYADLYADDGELIVPWREPIPRLEIAAMAAERLGQWRQTHHMITNHQIAVSGDRAHSRCYVQAVHLRTDDLRDAWVLGGRYDCTHRRVADSWTFQTLALTPVWQTGRPPTAVEVGRQ